MQCLRLVALASAFTISSQAFSQSNGNPNYVPPRVPKLYEKAPEDAADAPLHKLVSHPFVGAGVSFGQSRKSGYSPKTAYGFDVELGYRKVLDTWSHLEYSFDAINGSYGHADADLNVNFGILAKLGYGYNIGSGIAGVFKAGVGPLFASYRDSVIIFAGESKAQRKSAGQNVGLGIEASYTISSPITDSLSLLGGISWTNMSFVIKDVKDPLFGGKTDVPLVLNVFAVKLGLQKAI